MAELFIRPTFKNPFHTSRSRPAGRLHLPPRSGQDDKGKRGTLAVPKLRAKAGAPPRGKRPPNPSLPFSCFAPKVFGAIQEKRRFSFLVSLPPAPNAFGGARGYYHVSPTGFRSGSLRSQVCPND